MCLNKSYFYVLSILYIFRSPMDDLTPTMFVIRALQRAGWLRHADIPALHTSTSLKHFGESNFVRRRSYLQCLLSLDTLRERGLAELSSSQAPSYYRLVLTAATPGNIPVNQGSRHYDAMVKEMDSLPIMLQPVAAEESDEDSDLPIGSADPDHVLPPPAAARTQQSGLASSSSRVASSGLATQHGGNPADSASVFSKNEVTSDDVNMSVASAESFPSVTLSNIHYEEHWDARRKCSVKRLVATCPLGETNKKHFVRGCCCQKFRSIGQRQELGLGQRAIEAFLGCWLASRDSFPNREAHVKWNPSKSQIKQFMTQQGWPIP